MSAKSAGAITPGGRRARNSAASGIAPYHGQRWARQSSHGTSPPQYWKASAPPITASDSTRIASDSSAAGWSGRSLGLRAASAVTRGNPSGFGRASIAYRRPRAIAAHRPRVDAAPPPPTPSREGRGSTAAAFLLPWQEEDRWRGGRKRERGAGLGTFRSAGTGGRHSGHEPHGRGAHECAGAAGPAAVEPVPRAAGGGAGHHLDPAWTGWR